MKLGSTKFHKRLTGYRIASFYFGPFSTVEQTVLSDRQCRKAKAIIIRASHPKQTNTHLFLSNRTAEQHCLRGVVDIMASIVRFVSDLSCSIIENKEYR